MSNHIRTLRSHVRALASALAHCTDEAERRALTRQHYRATTQLLAYCSR